MLLKARGRDAEAEDVVLKHYGEGYVVPQVKLDQNNAKLSELFTRQTWRPHLYSGVFWFCQVGPFFAIFTFLCPVLNGLGVTDAVTVEIWLNVVQLAGAAFGLYLLHKLTRRGFVNWTFALMFVTLLALGLFGNAPLWLTVGLFAFYLFMAPASSPSSGHQKPRKRLCAKAEGSEAGKGRIPGRHEPLHHENALNTSARMPTRVT